MTISLVAVWDLEFKGRQIAAGEHFDAEDTDEPVVHMLRLAGKAKLTPQPGSASASAVQPMKSTDVEMPASPDQPLSNRRRK